MRLSQTSIRMGRDSPLQHTRVQDLVAAVKTLGSELAATDLPRRLKPPPQNLEAPKKCEPHGTSAPRSHMPVVLTQNAQRVYTVHIQMPAMPVFVISQADKRPMYLQIMEQIKRRVAVGDWAAGQTIPSIRQLAAEIGVSVITVKRAYLELEREGVIVTRQGKGCFVASDPEVGARIREQELAQRLEQAVRSAAMMGLSQKNLEKRIRAIYDRVTDEEKEPV